MDQRMGPTQEQRGATSAVEDRRTQDRLKQHASVSARARSTTAVRGQRRASRRHGCATSRVRALGEIDECAPDASTTRRLALIK